MLLLVRNFKNSNVGEKVGHESRLLFARKWGIDF